MNVAWAVRWLYEAAGTPCEGAWITKDGQHICIKDGKTHGGGKDAVHELPAGSWEKAHAGEFGAGGAKGAPSGLRALYDPETGALYRGDNPNMYHSSIIANLGLPSGNEDKMLHVRGSDRHTAGTLSLYGFTNNNDFERAAGRFARQLVGSGVSKALPVTVQSGLNPRGTPEGWNKTDVGTLTSYTGKEPLGTAAPGVDPRFFTRDSEYGIRSRKRRLTLGEVAKFGEALEARAAGREPADGHFVQMPWGPVFFKWRPGEGPGLERPLKNAEEEHLRRLHKDSIYELRQMPRVEMRGARGPTTRAPKGAKVTYVQPEPVARTTPGKKGKASAVVAGRSGEVVTVRTEKGDILRREGAAPYTWQYTGSPLKGPDQTKLMKQGDQMVVVGHKSEVAPASGKITGPRPIGEPTGGKAAEPTKGMEGPEEIVTGATGTRTAGIRGQEDQPMVGEEGRPVFGAAGGRIIGLGEPTPYIQYGAQKTGLGIRGRVEQTGVAPTPIYHIPFHVAAGLTPEMEYRRQELTNSIMHAEREMDRRGFRFRSYLGGKRRLSTEVEGMQEAPEFGEYSPDQPRGYHGKWTPATVVPGRATPGAPLRQPTSPRFGHMRPRTPGLPLSPGQRGMRYIAQPANLPQVSRWQQFWHPLPKLQGEDEDETLGFGIQGEKVPGSPSATRTFDKVVKGVKGKPGIDNPYAVAWSVVKKTHTKTPSGKWVKKKSEVERQAYMRAMRQKEAAAATSLGQLFRPGPVRREWEAWRIRRMQRQAQVARQVFHEADPSVIAPVTPQGEADPADTFSRMALTPNQSAAAWRIIRQRYASNAALGERKFDPDVGGGVDRDKIPAKDFAGPNRSFPIVTATDVGHAFKSLGRAKDTSNIPQIRSKIIRIAKRKGFSRALPDTAKDNDKEFAVGF